MPKRNRGLAGLGAAAAAAGVALAAYASHGLAQDARYWGLLAAGFMLAHGAVLAALAWLPPASTRLGFVSLCGIGLGCLVFSGSLFGAAVFGWPTRLAPAGGGLMIAAWIVYAIVCWRTPNLATPRQRRGD